MGSLEPEDIVFYNKLIDKGETQQRAFTLAHCFHNKRKYNCKYSPDIEKAISNQCERVTEPDINYLMMLMDI